MFRSRFIQPRSFSQVSGTWSRLFHIRKNLLSGLRPGTSVSERPSNEVEEPNKEKECQNPEKQNRYKLADTQKDRFQNKSFERTADGKRWEHDRKSIKRSWRKEHQFSSNRNKFAYSNNERKVEGNHSHSDSMWRDKPKYERNKIPRDKNELNFDRENHGNRKKFGKRGQDRPGYDNETDIFQYPKFKERVFTEAELREEEEYEKSVVEESDTGDRFGEGVFCGDEKKSTKKKSVLRMNQGKNWSETFGTINTEDESTVMDALFSEDPPPGSDADRIPADEMPDDEDDDGFIERPHIPLSRKNRRHIPHWYARRIEKLGKKGMVKEAIEVFDKWMIERDRVKPTHYEYGLMITLLGRAGYVQKAFNLFYQMKQMDLIPEPKVFTSLFNACAKSPIKNYGLKRANNLRSLMIEQGIEPNLITYQAMISAFGVCGDTEMAFSLIDEALQKYQPNQNLLCSALVACISDKEAGFRHAILVWRKLLQRGVKPNLTSYNLLLRAIKECGVGPLTRDNNLLLIETTCSSLDPVNSQNIRGDQKKIISSLQMKVDSDNAGSSSVVEVIEGVDLSDNIKTVSQPSLTDANIDNIAVVHDTSSNQDVTKNKHLDKLSAVGTFKHWWEYDLEKFTDTKSEALIAKDLNRESTDILHYDLETMPDILNPFNKALQVVSLGTVESKADRLALVGGMKGYLTSLERDGVKPDLVTFIQLITVVPPDEENEVLDMMALYDVKPDIDFFNHLVSKKADKGEWQAALAARQMIKEHGLVPNINTYGCWAKACRSRDDGKKLLQDMEDANLQPNTTIMQSLVKASYHNFSYKLYLLLQMKELGIPASSTLIERIEKDISQAKKLIAKKERGDQLANHYMHENFESEFWKFVDFYNRWITEIPLKTEEHPWSEFRDSTDKTETKESRITLKRSQEQNLV